MYGHEVVALMLLAAGAVVDATCNDGGTSLMLASLRGHDNVVKCLMDEAGVDADHKDSDGAAAAMHWASLMW